MSITIEDIEDIEDGQEESRSGSSLTFLGSLVVVGSLIAALMNHPPMAQVNSSSVNQGYVTMARQDASKYGISPDLFVKQINQESGFQVSVVSSAGAIGIAQFMPATAASLGVDPSDPASSLDGAAKLMASLDRYYGDYDKALAAYNAGSGAVNTADSNCGSGWEQCLPTETQNYIAAIEG